MSLSIRRITFFDGMKDFVDDCQIVMKHEKETKRFHAGKLGERWRRRWGGNYERMVDVINGMGGGSVLLIEETTRGERGEGREVTWTGREVLYCNSRIISNAALIRNN